MYRIIGIRPNKQRVVIATPKKAADGLVRFRAAQNSYHSVLIEDDQGVTITGFELSRRASDEAIRLGY